MLKLQVRDEAIAAIWRSVCCDLNRLTASQTSLENIVKLVAHEVGRVLLDATHNIFERVLPPALGAGDNVLRVRVVRPFHAHLTSATKNAYDISGHQKAPLDTP